MISEYKTPFDDLEEETPPLGSQDYALNIGGNSANFMNGYPQQNYYYGMQNIYGYDQSLAHGQFSQMQ